MAVKRRVVLPGPSFTATEAKNSFGRVMETALRQGTVVITRHDHPKAVLLSWEEFEALSSARSGQLASLAGEFDGLLAQMQTARSRRAMKAAFGSTPAQLGRAARKAASSARRG
jgi:antitoxin Phd